MLFILLLLIFEIGISQDNWLGIPRITNHEKDSYQAAAQNWDFRYDNNHIYFANNGGLLTYNGIEWQIKATNKNTIMRSLCIGNNRKIYVGAQNEIGYFQPDQNGILHYTELSDSLDQTSFQLSEIWDIETLGDTIVFSSETVVYYYCNGETKIYEQKSFISELSKIEDQIWIQTVGNGLQTIENGIQTFLKGSQIFNDFVIIAFEQTKEGEVLVITEKNGIYIYNGNRFSKLETNANQYLKDKRISNAFYDKKHGLFIGTHLGGLVKIEDDGKASLALSKKSGLQNNNILCLGLTPNGTLWVGTNNGIDEIDISSSFRKFFPDNDLEGAVYDLDEWQGKLFFSTSNGLYYIQKKSYYNPLFDNKYQIVPGTEGQTWGTDIINDQLYCAHHEGPLKINSNLNVEKISNDLGAWKFISLSENVIAIGTYRGVSIYETTPKGKFNLLHKVKDFEESSRIMVLDKFENLWVSHPYKNVYKINFQNDYKQSTLQVFDAKNGFQTNDRNYVVNINDHCYLSNETGIYNYNNDTDHFNKNEKLSSFTAEGNPTRRIIQHGNYIWVISDQFTSRIEQTDDGLDYKFEQNIFADLSAGTYIGGFEALFPLDSKNIILSTDNGALQFNLNHKDQIPEVKIKTIRLPLSKDSLIFGGKGPLGKLNLNSFENAIHFEYASRFPKSSEKLLYSHQLIGIEDEWSTWNPSAQKDYTNLPHGEYNFKVKAKTSLGIESNIEEFNFTIATPWHKSKLAYLLYLLIIGFCLYYIYAKQKKKYEKDADILISKNEEKEKELKLVKEENLQSEIRFKNMELANSTLHLLQKNQTLKTLKDKFEDLNKLDPNPILKKELNNILSIFRSDFRQEEDWGKFSFYFDQVHQDFIKKLKENYPILTQNDHKLCAYLKMNLNTKEIAPLLNISVRGVEISRYRLRKKLELDREINLNEFFNKM